MWLRSPNLESPHGFATREGGVSQPPYAGLNLSERVGDDPEAVRENRRRALATLGLEGARVARLTQVHSNRVVEARPGEAPEADGLITTEPGVVLVIETADCAPILLEDRAAGIVAAAHAGWRGTVAGIAGRAVQAMVERGARPERIRAALGPCISAENYTVGGEVVERFAAAGFPPGLARPARGDGDESASLAAATYRLDLRAANAWLLEGCGIPRENLWSSDDCSTLEPFFSYRRDGGTTGRMWSVIALPS